MPARPGTAHGATVEEKGEFIQHGHASKHMRAWVKDAPEWETPLETPFLDPELKKYSAVAKGKDDFVNIAHT